MMMIGAAAAEAAPSPAVTAAPTAVTSTSADLNGTINPGGLATYWEFQWGTTTGYGHNTTASGPLTGTGPVQVMAPISGLTPGTTYHFRLVAVQGAGGASGQPVLSGGSDISFTTPNRSGGGGGGNPNGSGGSRHSRASLRSRTLMVRHGSAQILWRCTGTSGATCRGRISLKARGKVGGKLKTVSCGAGTFSATTGHQHSVPAHLGSSCLTLLQNARHHRLRASLKAKFSQGTGNLKAPVTLVLAS